MKDKSLSYELIEKYFEGTASQEEISLYETRLQNDSIFANDVHNYIALKKGLVVYAKRKKLLQQLNIAHNEMSIKKSNANIISLYKKWKPLLVAASVAVLISIGTSLFLDRFNQNVDQKSHYKALKKDIDKVKKTQSLLWKTLNNDEQENFTGGTGISISSNGLILTDYHVIQGAKNIFIENDKFGKHKVILVYSNPKLDMAILKIEDSSFSSFGKLPYQIVNKKMKLGEKVYTLGYPNTEIVFGEGYISSLNGYEGDTLAYQVSIPVNPGNSGGPLFDEKGNLVGIINGKHTENEGAGFAIKAFEIAKSLELLCDSLNLKLPKQNTYKTSEKTKIIDKIQGYTFSIQVSK